MTITPDELIGAIKYDLAASGCNYPIVYKTSVEGETFRVSATVHWEENRNNTDDPTLDDWRARSISYNSYSFEIGKDINLEYFTQNVLDISSDIQEFIKAENLTV